MDYQLVFHEDAGGLKLSTTVHFLKQVVESDRLAREESVEAVSWEDSM